MTQPNKDKKRRNKEQIYLLFAKVANAIANPHRLELLDLLAQAPRTVEELANEAQMSIANTSQHLQRLKQARLVLDEREGLYVRYRLADPTVARLWLELRAVAEHQLAEVAQALDAYRSRRHEFEQISAAELRSRLRAGEVVLLDVRPQVEYQAGHLPEAISIPIDELERRLNELPSDKMVVAYCRGPYCVYADEALALLAERGWAVARLEEGVTEWQLAGYTVEI
jgi:rhodanese-related sulfurtransferase/DNA-binding transcriptional ArsR family regulator